MVELAILGRALGFAFAAGVNLYATVVLIGLVQRLGWVPLPPQFAVFGSPWVIGIAGALFVAEFIADKVPWLDTIWDGIHSAVRPLGGALLAVTALGEAHAALQGGAALVGALTAGASHFTKAGTRAMLNANPQPFSHWVLSLTEDVFALALTALALWHPGVAFVACLLLWLAILLSARLLVRAIKRRFLTPPPAGAPPAVP